MIYTQKLEEVLSHDVAIEQAELGQVRNLPQKIGDFERGESIGWVSCLLTKIFCAFGQQNFITPEAINSQAVKIWSRFQWLKICDFALYCSKWTGGEFGTTPPNLPTIFSRLQTWSGDKMPKQEEDFLTTDEQISENIMLREMELGRRLSNHEREPFYKRGLVDRDKVSSLALSIAERLSSWKRGEDQSFVKMVYERTLNGGGNIFDWFLLRNYTETLSPKQRRLLLHRWENLNNAPESFVQYVEEQKRVYQLIKEQEEKEKEQLDKVLNN